jgi:hypothetical protein
MSRLINAGGADVTEETKAAFLKAMGGGGADLLNPNSLEKAATITTSTGLVAYDLEAPSKNLYPVLTPIYNRIPRVTKSSGAGIAANWKTVTAIAPGGVSSMAWVPEGQRAPRMTITVATASANYVTIGVEDDVTFEAQSAGAGFEDVLATSGMRLLQQGMILSEYAILGGNNSVALGTVGTIISAVAGSSGTLPALTYDIVCVALTFEGFLAASLAGGVKAATTVTGMDNATYTVNGGSSAPSAVKTQAVTLGQILSVSVTAVRGAVGYAWYVGAAGAAKLEAITTINSATFSAPLTGGSRQLASAITVDTSQNTLAFDGLLYQVYKSGSLGYFNSLATGTPGTGTPLTSSGRGTITEIDTMLKSFWDNYRLSPDELYVNAQELTNIYNKVMTSTTSSLVRFVTDMVGPDTFVAGQVVGFYVNPYSLNGGQRIPIKLHPFLPAGTIFAWCQNLPAYYQSNQVPMVAEIQCRRDWYQIPWPIVTRSNATGVYSELVLKCYFTAALGIITNIGNG